MSAQPRTAASATRADERALVPAYRVTSPAPRAAWEEVLAHDPAAFVYQTPRGIDALCAEFDSEDVSRMYEFEGGRRLILPLYRAKHWPRSLSIERSPQIGSLVSPGPTEPGELRAIFEDLGSRSCLGTVVQPTAFTGQLWAAAAPADVHKIRHVGHVLDLEGGFETVWRSRFNSQAKRAVRKAEKADVEVECDRAGKLVPIFFELLHRSVDRWARQRKEPLLIARWRAGRRERIEKFQKRVDVLGKACRVMVARVAGRPAAAIIVLQDANAHYTRGAMDIDLAGPSRASFLLQKLAIEEACDSGCRYYNMGDTGTSESLARFKSHFGAKPYEHYEYRFERWPISRLENRVRGFAKTVLLRRT